MLFQIHKCLHHHGGKGKKRQKTKSPISSFSVLCSQFSAQLPVTQRTCARLWRSLILPTVKLTTTTGKLPLRLLQYQNHFAYIQAMPQQSQFEYSWSALSKSKILVKAIQTYVSKCEISLDSRSHFANPKAVPEETARAVSHFQHTQLLKQQNC